MPFSFTVLMILAGLAIRYLRDHRLGTRIMVTGAVLLLWFSSYPGSTLMMAPLEGMYEPLTDPKASPAPYIVVLGGGHNTDAMMPPTGRLNTSSMMRMAEGARIRNVLPESTLIFTGSSRVTQSSTAAAYYDAYLSLGQDSTNVVLLHEPLNTEQEAMAVREIVGEGPVILVTSATHIPRSVSLFRGQGIEVIPAPTDYRLRELGPLELKHFTWQPDYLWYSHRAFHEYFGILWARLRGRTG